MISGRICSDMVKYITSGVSDTHVHPALYHGGDQVIDIVLLVIKYIVLRDTSKQWKTSFSIHFIKTVVGSKKRTYWTYWTCWTHLCAFMPQDSAVKIPLVRDISRIFILINKVNSKFLP